MLCQFRGMGCCGSFKLLLMALNVAFPSNQCCNCSIMTKSIYSAAHATSGSRASQRLAVWKLLACQPGGDDEPLKIETLRDGSVRLGSGAAYKMVKRGVPSKSVEPLGQFLGIGKTELAKVLDLDRGTPARLAAQNKPLPSHAGEGVVRLLELESLASDVFETESDAANWLRKSHPMLDGDSPLEAAGSSFGTQRVKDILLAIKYGAAL